MNHYHFSHSTYQLYVAEDESPLYTGKVCPRLAHAIKMNRYSFIRYVTGEVPQNIRHRTACFASANSPWEITYRPLWLPFPKHTRQHNKSLTYRHTHKRSIPVQLNSQLNELQNCGYFGRTSSILRVQQASLSEKIPYEVGRNHNYKLTPYICSKLDTCVIFCSQSFSDCRLKSIRIC